MNFLLIPHLNLPSFILKPFSLLLEQAGGLPRLVKGLETCTPGAAAALQLAPVLFYPLHSGPFLISHFFQSLLPSQSHTQHVPRVE